MKRKELAKDWFQDLAKGAEDLTKVQPISRKALAAPPSSTEDIPPFRGISRQLLTRADAAKKLRIGITTLDKLLRDRLIFAHPRGRLVYVPIEECENYVQRAMLERDRRHA